jgi:Fe-S-cluster containining protein
MLLQQNLDTIAQAALDKEEENLHFKSFLKSHNSDEIDAAVFVLNENISPQIDCTVCGNCCRSLMINVEESDAVRMANALHISVDEFDEKYVEKSSTGSMRIMNKIPCHFLHDNKCAEYEARPNECREFPGLHQPNFNARLFATFMHYGRCPIIYNVVEALKEEMEFIK